MQRTETELKPLLPYCKKFLFEKCSRKFYLKRTFWFESKMKSKMKLDSEHYLTCYTWNKVNTNWRQKYFFWYCLNTIVRKFNNYNTTTVNSIQKNLSYLHEIGEQVKLSLWSKRYCLKLILTSIFICLQSKFLFQHERKLWRHLSSSSTCFCYYRKHPNHDNRISLFATIFFLLLTIALILCTYNHFHNVLRLFDVLPNFPFTASKTMRDYYL